MLALLMETTVNSHLLLSKIPKCTRKAPTDKTALDKTKGSWRSPLFIRFTLEALLNWDSSTEVFVGNLPNFQINYFL